MSSVNPARSDRQNLIFLHLAADCRSSVQKLIDAISTSEALGEIDIHIILSRQTSTEWDSDALPSHITTEVCESPDRDQITGLIMRRLYAGQGLTGIMVNNNEEQEIGTEVRQQSGRPVFVWRSWHAFEPLENNRPNRRFYNKQTDINCFISREIYQQFRAPRPNPLGLGNPYVLEQESLGDDSLKLMCEHGLLSLFFPTRQHQVSGNKRNFSHIKLTYVTHFYCNQKNTDSVVQLLAKYASYQKELLDRIHFVIVDDGSPIDYEIPDLPLNLTWLKIKQDVRWNQAGARNLGVLYAKSDNVIATDLDHEFPEETFSKLLKLKSVGKRLYKFWRKNPEDSSWQKGHPNIFLFSRGRFFELFGYDEEFAGNYGAEDFRFVKFQKDQGTIHKHLPQKYYCIERQDIDRSKAYHSLNRDLSFNTPVDARKKLEFEWYGHGYGHSRSSFNFEHEVLQENWREPPPPSIDKSWKRRYLLRTLLPRGW